MRRVNHLSACAPRVAALSLACWAALGLSTAQAAITVTGPVNPNVPIGPGDTDLGTTQVYFGGTLGVDAGSQFTLGGMTLAPNLAEYATALVTGTGTRVNLIGNGNRLEVGNGGTGVLSVSAGAVINARALSNPALDCGACYSFISNGAGSSGTLNIDGAGSFVDLWALTVGHAAVFAPNFGVPNGTSRGAVNVTGGGAIRSVATVIGGGPAGPNATGGERTFGSALISGAGSNWRIGTNLVNGIDAQMTLASHANATASVRIEDGGSLLLDAVPGRISNLVVGQWGAADVVVNGAGSNISFAQGATGVLQIGRNATAVGRLTVSGGGQVGGMYYTSVGRDGGVGSLTIDGAGSLYRMNGDNVVDPAQTVSILDIGRSGGTGQLNVRNGGRVEITATTARTNGPSLTAGRDAGSTGTINISGAGSVVQLSAASVVPGGGPTEAFNPFVRLGRVGHGTMNITGGGKLLMEGNAVSTISASRSTSLYVGGTGDTSIPSGGTGILNVSGAGSEVRMTGSDPFMAVGIGAGATGFVNLSDQALVQGMIVNIGRSGATGVMQVNGAQVQLAGQQTGNNLAGAGMTVGSAGGMGALHLSNGALVRIDNANGTATAGFNVGGTTFFPGGSGIVTMTGGSRLEVAGKVNGGFVIVGRQGVGVMQMTDSHVDGGVTGIAAIGREVTGVGTLVMNGNSSFVTGQFGIGWSINSDLSSQDGGVGTVIVNAGSTLQAQDITIGSKGYLGGTGTIVGNLINHGVINPGNSPGTLTLQGNFQSMAGSRLVLEIESDGNGGFLTDKLVFSDAALVDLAGLNIEFRFLGDLNPLAYQSAVGIEIDDFLQRSSGQVLPDDAFGKTTFTASAESYVISSFSYTPDGGAVITVVPEPETWALMAFGLAALAWRGRRRAAAAAVTKEVCRH